MQKFKNKIKSEYSASIFIARKYAMPIGIASALLSLSFLAEASAGTSVGMVKEITTSIVDLIKNEGKYGLQILSAAGGGLHSAKTASWQPLLIGAGAAGIIEIIFQAIKM